MKTLRELNLEYWGRVHDMCKGTNVKPWECLKYKHVPNGFSGHPDFVKHDIYEDYLSAVLILEDKPVFVGDKVYIKNNRYPDVNWELFEYWKLGIATLSKDWTWVPPAKKRTFTLNGVELPCPKPDFQKEKDWAFEVEGRMFFF